MASVMELFTDTERFFAEESENPSVLKPVGIMLVIGILSGGSAWIATQKLSQLDFGVEGVGSIMAALGVIGAVIALIAPLFIWVIYAGFFFLFSAFSDGEGGFKETLLLTGWGFVPRIFGALLGLIATFLAYNAVAVPETTEGIQEYSQAVASHPANLAASVVGILLLLWSATLWIPAMQEARNLDRKEAMIAVGVPVLIALLLRLNGLVTAL